MDYRRNFGNLASLGDVTLPENIQNDYVLSYSKPKDTWEPRPVLSAPFNLVVNGQLTPLLPNQSEEIFSFTAQEGLRTRVMQTVCLATGLGEMQVFVNQTLVGLTVNSFANQDIRFLPELPLVAGDTISIIVKNTSFQNETNQYVLWLYLREDPL